MKHFYDELVHKEINVRQEIQKILFLLNEENLGDNFLPASLWETIDRYYFRRIKAKANCISISEYLDLSKWDDGSQPNIDLFCFIVEKVSTLLHQVRPIIDRSRHSRTIEQIYTINELIAADLHILGFGLQFQNDQRFGEIAFVHLLSTEAVAALSLAPSKKVAEYILSYMRILDAKNSDVKRLLLSEIYQAIKPDLDRARQAGVSIMYHDEIANFINNLNIRHPNTNGVGTENTPFLKNISNDELIKIYDTLFSMLLNGVTQVKVADQVVFIREIKGKISRRA